MLGMKNIWIAGLLLAMFALPTLAAAQKDKEQEPTAWLHFLVIKDDNGNPVRNAAVIMHPVNTTGKQGKGGMELKTDLDGKTDFDGIPYGKLRVQVLASGYQTYGDDFDVNKPNMDFTIKLKRPQGQFSVYEDRPKDSPPPKDPPPADKKPD